MVDKLFNQGQGLNSSASLSTLLTTSKGPSATETKVTIDSSNPDAQSQVQARNEKLAGKLLNNLGKLQDLSSTIQKRMDTHDSEIKDKQKRDQVVKQDKAQQLESRLNDVQAEKDRIKNEVDNSQNSLREKEDAHSKNKEDLDKLVLDKHQSINDLKSQSKQTLNEKDKNIKDLQDEINKIKDEIKNARLQRKGLDDMVFKMQDMMLNKKLKLKEKAAAAADKDKLKADKKAELDRLRAELAKDQEMLDALKDDIKKQEALNDELKKKLDELLALKDKLKEDAYLLPQGADQAKAKLDALKNEVAQLKDQLDQLGKTLDQKNKILEAELKKHDDLLNKKQQNLLTQKLEKEGRENLMALQDLDQRLKKLLTHTQLGERILEQLIEEGGMKDEQLENQYELLRIDVQTSLGKQNELKSDLKLIEDKLLENKDISIEQLQASDDKMKQIAEKVGDLSKHTDSLDKKYQDKEKEYQAFVKKVEDHYKNKIGIQNGENKKLVDKITSLQGDLGEKVNAADKKLNDIELNDENMVDPMVSIKVKISQFLAKNKQVTNFVVSENGKLDKFKNQETKLVPDYILNYVHLGLELEKQHERLKKALEEDLKDLANLLKEIEDALKELEKLAEENKKNKARGKLDDMKKLGEDIDKKIGELQNRIDAIQEELNKLDPNEHGTLRDNLQKELDQLQKELDDCKEKNKDLKDQVAQLSKLPDEELAKQLDKINDLADQFKALDQHELPPIEKGIEDLEKKLKNAINKKKNNKKQDCLDSINNNKIKVKQLSDIIDKLEKEIARIDNEEEALERTYRYKDLERDHDLENKIKAELEDQKEKLQDLKEARDQLVKDIAQLEDNIAQDVAKGLPQDEQLKNWAQRLDESENIGYKIDDELEKAKGQQTKLDGTAANLNELNDKYKQKDKLYRTCLESQKKKQAKLDGIKRNALATQKKMGNVVELLDGMQTPEITETDLGEHLDEKRERLGKLQNRLEDILNRVDDIQGKIEEICSPLKEMGDREVVSPDLQKIIEELNKLDVLLQELRDDLNDLQKDLDKLMEDIKELQDKTKNLQLDEAEKAWNALQQKLRDTDKKYSEVEGKLSKYVQKIKEGMRLFSDDDEILDELKKLKDESDDIEKHLRQVDGKRNNLSSRERQAKDLLNKYKSRATPPTNEEIQQLVDKFRQMGRDSDNIYDELQQMSDDLDKRIDYLDGLMKRAGELQDLFKKYQKLIGDANKGLRGLQKDLDEATDLAHLLREVLEEMQKGLGRDYINRGDFIQDKQNELADQDAVIKQVADAKELIADTLDSLKNQKIASIVNCELQDLLDQIPRYEELNEKIQDLTSEIKETIAALKKIRQDIDVADVPKNIRDREGDFENFSRKLKQYEQDLADIQKLCMYNPLYDALKDVKLIEQNIKTFTEQKVRYQRVLKQELAPFEQTPAKLEPLPTLKEVIQKVRELGDKLINSIDQLGDCLAEANKLKKQIGGQDQQNKWKALEMKEDDLRRRLNELKKRFKLIHKGGEDCDGYTSNPEETTFIDSLLNDKPEINTKQVDLLQRIDDIQGNMFSIRNELEDVENQDFMQSSKELSQKLNEIEDGILSADRDLTYLEKLADSVEEKFIAMNAPKKLDKRQTEISEIAQVATHFKERVAQTQGQISDDLKIIEKQSKYLEKMGIDPAEDKNKEDLVEVQAELNDYLKAIEDIFNDIDELEQKRQGVQQFYNEKVVKESPYKNKHHKKEEHFQLLDLNSQVKKKILDLIKMLKDIQNNIRDIKRKYQQLRANYAGLLSRKMYSAMKGDLVDEQVGEYINKLTFDVPIKKVGSNQYTIGNRKIIASLINEKLMVRVGGGYVGMDEFMMVYGSAELLRIQKDEAKNAPQDFDFIRTELLANYFIGDFLGEDTLDVEPTQVELQQLKSKIRQDYNTRKGRLYRTHEIGERTSSEGRKPVVGILDARNALKKNVQTIITGDGQASQTSGKNSSRMGFQANSSRNTTVNKLGERNNPSAKGSGFSQAIAAPNQKRMSVAVKSKPPVNSLTPGGLNATTSNLKK